MFRVSVPEARCVPARNCWRGGFRMWMLCCIVTTSPSPAIASAPYIPIVCTCLHTCITSRYDMTKHGMAWHSTLTQNASLHACMYACKYTRMRHNTQMNTQSHSELLVLVCTHMHISTHMHKHLHLHARTGACAHTHAHACQ